MNSLLPLLQTSIHPLIKFLLGAPDHKQGRDGRQEQQAMFFHKNSGGGEKLAASISFYGLSFHSHLNAGYLNADC